MAALSVGLVTCVFAAAFLQTYLAPPVYDVVIYEIWEVKHPKNDRVEATDLYTVGQGVFSFYGYHDFEAGKSYHVKYFTAPNPNRISTLLSFSEVTLPG